MVQEIEIDSNFFQHHGKTTDGDIACCKLSSARIVDCIACLEAELLHFHSKITVDERELLSHILSVVRTAGPNGLTRAELTVRLLLYVD